MNSRTPGGDAVRLADGYRMGPEPLVVVMGVSGCGKSTVGMELAQHFGVPFVDGDDLHPEENVAKMRAGIPLTGDDRRPWLESVGDRLQRSESTGLVLACSALRVVYRDIIRAAAPRAFFLHLEVPREVLAARVSQRPDHYMPPSLLDDQLMTLEPLRVGENGAVVRADRKLDAIVRDAIRAVEARKEYV